MTDREFWKRYGAKIGKVADEVIEDILDDERQEDLINRAYKKLKAERLKIEADYLQTMFEVIVKTHIAKDIYRELIRREGKEFATAITDELFKIAKAEAHDFIERAKHDDK